MSLKNAKRVIRVATIYPAFRTAFRANPQQALRLFARDLALDLAQGQPLSVGQIDAIGCISDEEYSSLARIASHLGDPMEKSESEINGFVF